jgi:hypothetical protein
LFWSFAQQNFTCLHIGESKGANADEMDADGKKKIVLIAKRLLSVWLIGKGQTKGSPVKNKAVKNISGLKVL